MELKKRIILLFLIFMVEFILYGCYFSIDDLFYFILIVIISNGFLFSYLSKKNKRRR